MVDRGDARAIYFSMADGPLIKTEGEPAHKVPSTVYLYRPKPHVDAVPGSLQAQEFVVQTNEGFLSAPFGDYVAYDPKSGHVWPVSADYIAMHYEFGDAPEAEAAPPARVVNQGSWGAHLVAEPGQTFELRQYTDSTEDGIDVVDHLVIEVIPRPRASTN